MFFILSKVLDFTLSPFYWVLFLLIVGVILYRKNKKKAKLFLISAFILTFFFTNPLIYNITFRLWETPPYPAGKIKDPYELGILLGGSLNKYDVDNERVIYSHSVDRLMQTIDLYKKGKIRKILLSGGSGHVMNQKFRESDYASELLVQFGVDRDDIIIENKSKNTYENALFSANIIRSYNISGDFLLITSAFHMKRSLACFNKAGITTTAFPVDIKAGKLSWAPDSFILPEPYGFVLWDILIHEWFGIVVYKVLGYI